MPASWVMPMVLALPAALVGFWLWRTRHQRAQGVASMAERLGFMLDADTSVLAREGLVQEHPLVFGHANVRTSHFDVFDASLPGAIPWIAHARVGETPLMLLLAPIADEESILVLCARVTDRSVPACAIRARRGPSGNKLEREFLRGVTLEGDSDFSSAYKVFAAEEEAARAALRPEVRQLLKREGRWSVESDGHWLVAYRGTVEADELPAFVHGAMGLFAVLAPSFREGPLQPPPPSQLERPIRKLR